MQLRADRDDAPEENCAAKVVIKYFRTHNPPQKPRSGQSACEPAGDFEQKPQRGLRYLLRHLITPRGRLSGLRDEESTGEEPRARD